MVCGNRMMVQCGSLCMSCDRSFMAEILILWRYICDPLWFVVSYVSLVVDVRRLSLLRFSLFSPFFYVSIYLIFLFTCVLLSLLSSIIIIINFVIILNVSFEPLISFFSSMNDWEGKERNDDFSSLLWLEHAHISNASTVTRTCTLCSAIYSFVICIFFLSLLTVTFHF